MHKNILLAAALQQWDHYSAYALTARAIAADLARGADWLHVLSVYDYETRGLPMAGLTSDVVARLKEHAANQTDRLLVEKMEEYVAPLQGEGLPVSTLLRVGSPRHVIVEVATELEADLVVIGTHSKRGLFDVALGETARHVSEHAPCTVLLVAPTPKT